MKELIALIAVGFTVLMAVLLQALPFIIVVGFSYWLFFM